MRNVLITGGLGFLGSNFIEHLLNKDSSLNITIIVNSTPSNKNRGVLNSIIANKINIIAGDILNYNQMDNIVSFGEIDTIFQFAAQPIVRICENNPLGALHTNVVGTANLAEIARTNKSVKHLIALSSDKSYGASEDLPYIEDFTPLKGTRPYEATKTLMDMWLQMYQINYNTPISIIRGANIFGPGDSNFSRLVPQVCTSIAKNINPWIWSGVANYKREFIYVEDDCEFLYELAIKSEKDPSLIKHAYNLGSGNVFTIKDFVNKIISLTNKDLELEIKEKDFEFKEIEEQYLSLDKAEKLVGWKAKYTGSLLDNAILRTYNYYESLVLEGLL